jgi:hypothetical protein
MLAQCTSERRRIAGDDGVHRALEARDRGGRVLHVTANCSQLSKKWFRAMMVRAAPPS